MAGIFSEKNQLNRKKLKESFKKSTGKIPGTGGKRYSFKERKEMLDKVFPYKKTGSHISIAEVKNKLRNLRKEEYNTLNSSQKREIKNLRAYLEKETGIKHY